MSLRRALFSISLITAGLTLLACEQRRDVSDEFKEALRLKWCTTKDGFVVRYPDTGELAFKRAGAVVTPHSLKEYEENPFAWTPPPGYVQLEIVAGVPAQSPFRVDRVFLDTLPPTGRMLVPMIVFDEISTGAVDGRSLLDDSFKKSELRFGALVTRCTEDSTAVTPSSREGVQGTELTWLLAGSWVDPQISKVDSDHQPHLRTPFNSDARVRGMR